MMKYILALFLLLSCACAAQAEDKLEQPLARLVEKKNDLGTLSYPILMNLENFTAQEDINVDTLAQMADWHCHLEDGEPPPANMSFNAKSKITLFNEVAFSYITAFDYYCGGPYPDANIKTNNYYLHTGRQFSMAEMFPVSMPRADINAFIMKDHAIENAACRDVYEDPELSWDFYMTPENVVFRPSFPHAMQACVQDFPVSAERMQDYLLPGTLSRPALHQDEYRD